MQKSRVWERGAAAELAATRARVAQWLEHHTDNVGVGSSILPMRTKLIIYPAVNAKHSAVKFDCAQRSLRRSWVPSVPTNRISHR